nr:accessory subunit of RNA polymerase [Saccharomycopsis crataegensis]
MKELKENLDFFSDITQSTLSAFHISGVDNDLYENIENLRRCANNIKTKTLVTIERTDQNIFKRFFTDGTEDEVEEDYVLEPALYEESLINNKLNITPDPITSIKSNKIIKINDKKISTPIEHMFFSSANFNAPQQGAEI